MFNFAAGACIAGCWQQSARTMYIFHSREGDGGMAPLWQQGPNSVALADLQSTEGWRKVHMIHAHTVTHSLMMYIEDVRCFKYPGFLCMPITDKMLACPAVAKCLLMDSCRAQTMSCCGHCLSIALCCSLWLVFSQACPQHPRQSLWTSIPVLRPYHHLHRQVQSRLQGAT